MPFKKDPSVAIFTDTYDEINGVGNTYRHLTDYCRRQGKPVDIFTYTMGKTAAEVLDGVTIFRYHPKVPFPVYSDLIFDPLVFQPRIMGEFKSKKYDLIHTATPGSMGLNALWAAWKFGIPLIGAYHTAVPEFAGLRVPEPMKRPVEKFFWKYVKWYYDHCRLVLAPSAHTRSYLEQRLKPLVDIFSRGIDSRKFSPSLGEKQDKVTVLYVGRLAVEKNLGLLVETFKDKTDVRLMVVGGGPYKKKMEQALGKTAVFTGVLTGEPLSRAYASADIFAYPSETDTFGNVILEAMSSGLPAVVTDKWAPKELVIEGKTGFIAKSREEFKDRVEALIKDPELRTKMGANAREFALERRWDSVFENLFCHYRKVAYPDKAD